MKKFLFCAAALASFATPADAAIFNLSFDNDVVLTQPFSIPITFVGDASFAPVTMFDGDVLNISFTNVTYPYDLPTIFAPPGTLVTLRLDSVGSVSPVHLIDTFAVGGQGFGDGTIPQYGSIFQTYGYAAGWFFGPDWNVSLKLLSGEPLGSEGLTLDHIHMQVALVPEPSTWAMMVLGSFSLVFLTYRRRNRSPYFLTV